MNSSSAAPPDARKTSIIPALCGSVTALRTHAFLAIIAALALRLLFVFRFPGSAGDSDLYLQFARNWADHDVFGFWSNGISVPTDLRMPGYPAFLAGVALLFGRSVRAILLSQAALDSLTCILTAALAAALAPAGKCRRILIIALWLAATCPFLANYSAVVLTETLVTFLSTAALICFVMGLKQEPGEFRLWDREAGFTPVGFALLGSLLVGCAALVRPEMPLLLGIAAVVYGVRSWRGLGIGKSLLLMAAMGGAMILPLVPWAARNFVTLKKVQFLAPRYATLPGEYAPVGYYAWTATWLERYRDVYLTVWQIGEEPIELTDMPATAFDSPEEKARVADLLSQYNDSPDMEISPELDAKFAEIARERTARHPFRTYLEVPLQRMLSIWFTPRTELLNIDGKFWPLRQQWQDSRANVVVTGSFAALGYLYVALAIAGMWIAMRAARIPPSVRAELPASAPNLWGIALLLAYVIIRTVFLTTVEAPEPRYVISCYPIVLAFASMLGAA